MPFARPTLSELVDRVRSDLRSRLGLTASLSRAFADVMAAVWAGAVHLNHGYLQWLSKQLFATTAEQEALYAKASMYNIAPSPATFATGSVQATGDESSVISAGTVLVRDDGVTYIVDDEETISGGTATLDVTAVIAGAASNYDAGETLSLESPIDGVDPDVTVLADPGGDGIAGGIDADDVEDVRIELLERLRRPPEGGADQDWIAWAKQVPGVTRAWVYRWENGLGTVVVRFVLDDQTPTIFPDGATVALVQAELDSERPTTAEVTAVAPTPVAVDFDIRIDPDTTEVRDAVTAELTDLFFRDAQPGDGAGAGTILLSHVLVAIGIADGVDDFTLLSPSGDTIPGLGEMPTVGDITWEDAS